MDDLEDLPFRQFNLPLPSRGPGEVAVLDFGRLGAPVAGVFLHANGFNARTYRRLLGPASRFGRILAFDQRGHGATTLQARPEGRRDWLDLRDDLLAFAEALDLKDVTLCGHSMGGTVSLLAGREAPDRVHRLLLLDPVMIPDLPAPAGDASPMVAGALRRRATFANRGDARAAYRGRGAFATWPDAMIEDYVEGVPERAWGRRRTRLCASMGSIELRRPGSQLMGSPGIVCWPRADPGRRNRVNLSRTARARSRVPGPKGFADEGSRNHSFSSNGAAGPCDERPRGHPSRRGLRPQNRRPGTT